MLAKLAGKKSNVDGLRRGQTSAICAPDLQKLANSCRVPIFPMTIGIGFCRGRREKTLKKITDGLFSSLMTLLTLLVHSLFLSMQRNGVIHPVAHVISETPLWQRRAYMSKSRTFLML